MGERRILPRTWALAAAAALLAPAAAPAQFFYGYPGIGRPPVTLYSPVGVGSYWPGYYSLGGYGGVGSYGPGYYGSGSYGLGGYGGVGSYGPGYYGSGSYGLGGYGGFSYPYGNFYAYNYTTTPYLNVPTYSPFMPVSPAYGSWAGLAPAGSTAYAAVPYMRNKAYPLSTTGGLTAGLPASSLTGPAAMRPTQYASDTGIRAAAYAAGPALRRAEVDVRLPSAKAELWFDGVRTSKTGKQRQFFTPQLRPGARYTYTVRARWRQNGRVREDTRNVYLRPGDVLEVDFTRPGKGE
jgi:uncharacterized protein (TIGR03000 family)